MPEHRLPVRPNLDQLKTQAKDLLRALKSAEPPAITMLNANHPHPPKLENLKLADAQLTLARSYRVPSWQRLVLACRMTDAIWRDDPAAVRELVFKHPKLLTENARGVADSNWGPPMSYAANVGRNEIVTMLREQGAADVQYAFERACLQGKLDTARLLYEMGARPVAGSVMGPCETLNPAGLAFQLELGAELTDAKGDRLAPLALLLEIYSRNPEGKHRCLEIMTEQGYELPDTPPMAVHRGRIDLLEAHLRRDPHLMTRTFSHQEIYPPELGCHADESLALHGTPLAGGALLHLCVDYDEVEIAEWLFKNGCDVNVRAAVDADGFGGHTALFGCIVSQSYRCGRQKDGAFARMLLERGADTEVRASLRKRLRFVADETLHEYHDVTPREWGERFQDQDWVNPAAMQLLAPDIP
jgi:ankyrin repeat protein